MEILYFDKHIAVCRKEVGMMSEDGENSVPQKIKEQLGGEVFTVHRLDLNVGGVMVYARTKFAAAKLSQQIQDKKFKKEYVAVLNAVPEPTKGILCDLLFKDKTKNKVFVVKRRRKGVKEARLYYKTLESDSTHSLVHIILDTGRSHQIRVQFSSRKWPLAGDHKYGSRDEEKSPALYSSRITFEHPASKEEMTFICLPSGGIWDKFYLSQELFEYSENNKIFE